MVFIISNLAYCNQIYFLKIFNVVLYVASLYEVMPNVNTFSILQIVRYNALLTTIKSSLTELQKGIRGLVVMSADLEETFNCIFDGRVPPLWEKVRTWMVSKMAGFFSTLRDLSKLR